jgi:hypothetical protein
MSKLEERLNKRIKFTKEKLGLPLAGVSLIGIFAFSAVTEHRLAVQKGRLQGVYESAVILYESNPTPEQTDWFKRTLYDKINMYLSRDHQISITTRDWERAFKKAGIKDYQGKIPPQISDLRVDQLKKIFEAYIY